MSKAAKQSIFILIFLLIGSLGFAGYTVFEKQALEQEKIGVEEKLRQTRQREQEKTKEAAQLNEQVKQLGSQKDSLERRLSKAQKESEDLKVKTAQAEQDLSKWQSRVSKVSEERDALLTRLQDAEKKTKQAKAALAELEEASKSVQSKPTRTAQAPKQDFSMPSRSSSTDNAVVDEQYWASLLKEKASLEVMIEDLKSRLSEDSIELVDFKQKNANMAIELDKLKAEKDEISREIKYKNDLVNNLSLELARTKNDKKFVNDRLEKVGKENSELRDQLKRLVSSKSALEKSIVRLSKDKDKMNKKLEQSENLIQSRIDEIWEIKENLDQAFQTTKDNAPTNREVELPPIVVSAEGTNAVPFDSGMSDPGFNGRVVSLNDDNNFVIVDIGNNSGISLGDTLSVYRDSKYVARLEVIQVRNDISAADIKDQWSKIQVGDTVR